MGKDWIQIVMMTTMTTISKLHGPLCDDEVKMFFIGKKLYTVSYLCLKYKMKTSLQF